MKEPRPVSLLLTHYHWDDLLGLPFFATLYQPGWDNDDLRADPEVGTTRQWLDTIFKSPFFPVPDDHLPNKPNVGMVEPRESSTCTGFEIECST